MAELVLEGVEKRYPKAAEPSVRALDLRVPHGEFLTLVGPSGCGKSTTLNLIAGLEGPTAGRLLLDGKDVTRRSPSERNVAMVFQSYALYPHLDVRGNLAFPLQVAGLARPEIEARVAETAALLGLEALLARRPGQLSGGQRQRVALGRALVRRPSLFLFDEPLSNLDAALRAQMRAEIKKLHQRLGATFIYVTHDQAEAMTLSDRVAVMDKGVLQQLAPPREVYDRPANLFVARFFGSPAINLLPPGRLGLAAPEALAGLRPEEVTVAPAGEPGAVEARVDLVEPMGPETWVTALLGEDRLVARGPSHFQARPGEPVWLRLDPARALLFDAKSGRRLERG